MQSPYASASIFTPVQTGPAPSLTFPAADTQLLPYLERNHITYVWASHWIGNVVMYLEDQRVLCADYVDVMVWHGATRFPHTAELIAAADRPSFIVRYDPSRGKPDVATALDRLNVSYTMAQFGPLWVITPRSRTVQPQEILQELEADY
jgi:hypothetical protein